MDSILARSLASSGIILLGLAALTGFAQVRYAPGSPGHSLWRVVHSGGTAGAVQLIALGAVLDSLDSRLPGQYGIAIVAGVALATWAFFVGPLLRALGKERAARCINLMGAVLAAPAYLALPLLLI